MKKYGEAAVVEMIMNALPEIAKNVAEPLSKVDKITMYGEGNSAKLLSDIVNGTTQVTEGIASGMGIDIKSLIMGALGGKLASDGKNDTPVVVVQPSTEAAATQNNKTELTALGQGPDPCVPTLGHGVWSLSQGIGEDDERIY